MDDQPSNSPSGYRTGDIKIDLVRRRVTRGDQDIRLGRLSYELLAALVRAAPGVLSKDELVEKVWGGRFVSRPTITQRIVLLRQALGDDADQPRYIGVVRGHGYALVPPAEPLYEHAVAPSSSRPAYRFAAVLGVTLLAAFAVYHNAETQPGESPSLAILPFDNLSPGPDDSYFATGLREEIIDQLMRIDRLRVVSRTSPDRKTDGELAVDAEMEGSVFYQDRHVRVRLRLVDPVSGDQVWSHTYARESTDILGVQNEIAVSVAGAMGVSMGIRASNAFRGAGTSSIDAYEAFLAGLAALNQVQGQDRAIAFFGRATDLDPGYAAAWAQKGFAIAAKSFYAPPERTGEILDQAMPPLLRAVELDPQSARAAAILGFVRYSRLDWIGGAQDHSRAINLQPSRLTLGQHAGLLVRAGRLAAARSEISTADRIDRLPDDQDLMHIQVSIAERHYGEARELAGRLAVPVLRQRLMLNIALNEGDAAEIRRAMLDLMNVESMSAPLFSALLRTFDSRDAALDVVRAVHRDETIRWPAKQHDIALLAAYYGEPELAIEAITEEASLSTVRLWALWYPIMSDVRKSLAFKELVTELNLVAYWRAYGWADACAPLGESDFRCT